MKGILVNYEYCTGCHSCEVACKKYHNLPEGEFGIKVSEIGPYQYADEARGANKWEWTWLPGLTKVCDLCEERTAKNKMPMCVQHCQAWCMAYGELEDLIKKVDAKSRYAILTPKE